ncbi:MAG TPA: GspE/PulE family protein [Chthonomonadaceae bacterium]|nr:GspE/PulE family protein [Chthonomonadaceae bacterium]
MAVALAPIAEPSFAATLVAEGLISQETLNRVLGQRLNTAERLGDTLVQLGLITEKDRTRCHGQTLGVPFVDLQDTEIDAGAAKLLSPSVAQRLCAVPIERSDLAVSVAMADPCDIVALDEIQSLVRLPVDPYIATEEAIREAIARNYGGVDDIGALVTEAMSSSEIQQMNAATDDQAGTWLANRLRDGGDRSAVVRLADALFSRAIAVGASDIHIAPGKDRVRVRFRVDGMLQEAMELPIELQWPLVSRIKIMSSMDIAERRVPQDGRLALVLAQGEYDFRVSTYPCIHGENMVLRVLDRKASRMSLQKIGMEGDMLDRLMELIHLPYGMVLVCGPTGSGKTTTLYACLNRLNSVDRNIMTVEDPVEYQVAGIVQGNINPKVGVTFSSGLRTLLRQDPDVILIGEIRDVETARIAIEAALTGHLVLSTIHSNDAGGAISRLLDMGVEPFLITAALVATVAQRLVRTVCPRCAGPVEPSPAILRVLDYQSGPNDPPLQQGRGCEYCSRRGYKGRTGIYEMLHIDDTVKELILNQASAAELRRAGLFKSRSLREDAIGKMRAGITTAEEILRVTA